MSGLRLVPARAGAPDNITGNPIYQQPRIARTGHSRTARQGRTFASSNKRISDRHERNLKTFGNSLSSGYPNQTRQAGTEKPISDRNGNRREPDTSRVLTAVIMQPPAYRVAITLYFFQYSNPALIPNCAGVLSGRPMFRLRLTVRQMYANFLRAAIVAFAVPLSYFANWPVSGVQWNEPGIANLPE